MFALHALAVLAVLSAAPAADPPLVPKDVRQVALPLLAAPPGQRGQVVAALSDDGKTLLVCGQGTSDNVGPTNTPPAKLVLVDLDAGKVTAERVLPVQLGPVAIDAHHAYIGLSHSGEGLLVLDRQTLADKRRVATRGVSVLTAHPGGLLEVVQSGVGTLVLAAPDLGVVGPLPGVFPQPQDRPVWVRGRWWDRGVLTDGRLEKPLLVSAPSGFLTADWGGDLRGGTYPQPARVAVRFGTPAELAVPLSKLEFGRWGMRVNEYGVLEVSGDRAIGVFQAVLDGPHDRSFTRTVRLLATRPLAVVGETVGRWRADNPWPRVYRTELSFHDLTTGVQVGRIALPGEKQAEDGAAASRHGQVVPLVFARPDDQLAVIVGSTLYLVPAAAVPAGDAVEPLRCRYESAVTVLSGRDPVAIPLPAVAGGRPPLLYSFVGPAPDLELDPATGRLRATAPARLTDRLADLVGRSLAEPMSHAARAVPRDAKLPIGATAAGQVDLYLGQTAARYEQLTGRKPAGVPVWVPVSVLVRDADLATVRIDTGYFVDVPTAPVMAAADALFREYVPNRFIAPLAAPKPAPPAADLEVLQARVRALEARLDELTRKLEAVLPSTKPKDK